MSDESSPHFTIGFMLYGLASIMFVPGMDLQDESNTLAFILDLLRRAVLKTLYEFYFTNQFLTR